jgi:hypothetical protein
MSWTDQVKKTNSVSFFDCRQGPYKVVGGHVHLTNHVLYNVQKLKMTRSRNRLWIFISVATDVSLSLRRPRTPQIHADYPVSSYHLRHRTHEGCMGTGLSGPYPPDTRVLTITLSEYPLLFPPQFHFLNEFVRCSLIPGMAMRASKVVHEARAARPTTHESPTTNF